MNLDRKARFQQALIEPAGSIPRDLVIMLASNAHGSQPKQITGRCLPRM